MVTVQTHVGGVLRPCWEALISNCMEQNMDFIKQMILQLLVLTRQKVFAMLMQCQQLCEGCT